MSCRSLNPTKAILIHLAIVLVLPGMLLCAGCGQSPSKPEAKGMPLPDGFPADIPIYSPATVSDVQQKPKAIVLKLKTADSVQQVEGFYREKLKQTGWQIRPSSIRTAQQVLLQVDKESRQLSVIILATSGETTITLGVEK